MLESLFNKIAGLQACNFIKKRLQHSCFPVNIVTLFKNTNFQERLQTAAANVFLFLKKKLFFFFHFMKVFYNNANTILVINKK